MTSNISIGVNILDAYSFRCQMKLLSDIQKDVIMLFTNDHIIVNEVSSNQSKTIKLVIRTEDILSYKYDVRDCYGNFIPSYSITFSAAELFNTIKKDGKKESLVFYMEVDPTDLSNKGIHITKTKSFESITTIKTSTYPTTATFGIEDHYEKYYSKRKPNARISVSEFNEVLKMCSVDKFDMAEFIKKDDVIYVQSQQVGGITKNVIKLNSGLFGSYESSGDAIETETNIQCGFMKITVENNSIRMVVLNTQSIKLMMELSKICPSGVIKLYLDEGMPLVVTSHIGIYGTCILSFVGDK